MVLHTATELGIADIKELSADTTVQEVPIGYPNEPGILKGLAERSQRALLRLKNKAGKKTEFGFKYLIGRIGGGYLFGKLFIGNVNEQAMPPVCLAGISKDFRFAYSP